MKDVIISIKSAQKIEGIEQDGVELVTKGTYSYGENETVFEYMESELTGLRGTKTEFKLSGDTVMITRSGGVDANMLFREGHRHYFVYGTGYGNIMMSIDTRNITAELSEDGGNLKIDYIVDMENSVISRNTFKINIREA